MPLILNDLKLPLGADESSLSGIAARTLGIHERDIQSLRINRVSLDARKKREICFIYTVTVALDARDEQRLLKRATANVAFAPERETRLLRFGTVKQEKPIVVAGLGPAGLFAAYMLAKHGYAVIAVERGKCVEERKKDVDKFFSGGGLNCESNIMFGEGGAGAFSDGKLTTRIKDVRAHEVVDILADNGAPAEIRIMAKPHIGTDILVKTVSSLRKEIERLGGVVKFETRLCGINAPDGKIEYVSVEHGGTVENIPCERLILATGQGAVDTYELLDRMGVEIVTKAFAAGVRIEHPRELIDKSQYGEFAGHPRLGAAEYHLADKSNGRGVYTFCMCPGGVVIGSSSAEGEVVTNGMSCYARDGENSNAAIVVQVTPEDCGAGALAGLRFRTELENAAYRLGGGEFIAPAECVGDYLRRRKPSAFSEVKPTYKPDVRACDVSMCLPDFMSEGVRDGIKAFSSRLRGFDMDGAVITAVESRTSSPVRIVRGENGDTAKIRGLYPVGEGAGYAGGIVSAAVDGMRSAEIIMAELKP